MLLNFIKPHELPHESLIKKDTAYVLQDLETETAVIYFSTKDADPIMYRTLSLQDVHSVVNELGVGSDGLDLTSYPTKADYDAAPPTKNTFVHIEADEAHDDEPTTSLFLASSSSLFLLSETSSESSGTYWQSQEW